MTRSTQKHFSAISLFSGAGGMDVGFEEAGIGVVVANEMQPDACETFLANHLDTITIRGDILNIKDDIISACPSPDIVFGGPPCQGFSVAGKMEPTDPRSQMIFTFLDIIEATNPKAFVMENVKALGVLSKWENVRQAYLKRVEKMGYTCEIFTLIATDFGVPQKRERSFFVGIKGDIDFRNDYEAALEQYKKEPPTVKELLLQLPTAGSKENPLTCTAKITFTKTPIMRATPWAGMYFNGAGRPINLDGYANTLPASMGGNKSPIIDEAYLRGESNKMWMESYHKELLDDIKNVRRGNAPKCLRRLTIKEAALLQSFPDAYKWHGSKSSIYRQIGNAVPVKLAEAIAHALIDVLEENNV